MPYKDHEKTLQAKRRYRATHKDEIRQRAIEWRLANPGYSSRYYRENHEHTLSTQRAWNTAHPEYKEIRRNTMSVWRKTNPDRVLENCATRRARKVGAFVEEVDRQVVFNRDQGICGICQEAVDPQDWHLDHKIALSRGGEHSYANTQVAHPMCNMQKGAR